MPLKRGGNLLRLQYHLPLSSHYTHQAQQPLYPKDLREMHQKTSSALLQPDHFVDCSTDLNSTALIPMPCAPRTCPLISSINIASSAPTPALSSAIRNISGSGFITPTS